MHGETNGFAAHSATIETPMHRITPGESEGDSALEREAQELGISAGQLKAIIVRVGTDRHRVAAAARRISECAMRGASATAAI